MSSDETENPYDRVPYTSIAFRETHPVRLQAVGHLFNLNPPAVETARVLELGCAAGGNILPIAAAWPDCSILGIDLSARQVEEGKASIRATGLTNIELRHQSILDLPPTDGPFDYILCHGVLSWVPPAVQEKILDICRNQLSPRGVAYISFNTYPGWHVRMWARDVMLYHAGGIPDDRQRVKEAVEFLKAIVESPEARKIRAIELLGGEVAGMLNKPQEYLLHEYLEEHNHPFYFHEFIARCGQHGLQYLGDARTNGVLIESSSLRLQKAFSAVQNDVVRLEQYADFVRNQMFRRSLLCHASSSLDRGLAHERLKEMAVSSPLAPDRTSGTVPSNDEMRFVGANEAQVRSSLPVIKAALFYLYEAFPTPLRLGELCRRVRTVVRLTEQEFAQQEEVLAESLLQYWLLGMIEAYVTPPHFATRLTQRPRATRVARHEASVSPRVTNLRHETYMLDDAQRKIIGLCDGGRTRGEIAGELGMGDPNAFDAALYQLTRSGFLLE
jgi:SAM-dependent methyltransferase